MQRRTRRRAPWNSSVLPLHLVRRRNCFLSELPNPLLQPRTWPRALVGRIGEPAPSLEPPSPGPFAPVLTVPVRELASMPSSLRRPARLLRERLPGSFPFRRRQEKPNKNLGPGFLAHSFCARVPARRRFSPRRGGRDKSG